MRMPYTTRGKATWKELEELCAEQGWYARWTDDGWVECDADHPKAVPDMNRVWREIGPFDVTDRVH